MPTYDSSLSKEIYDQLMNGKIINKNVLNNSSQFIENILFNEIMDNLKAYRSQYEMSGFELVVESTYIFIRESKFGRDDLKTDIAMKACLLLLLLGKYLNENNYRMSKLSDPSGGITKTDIEAILEMEDTPEILEKANMKSDLYTSIKTILIDRFILLEKKESQSYILSDAGRAFYDEMKLLYEN